MLARSERGLGLKEHKAWKDVWAESIRREENKMARGIAGRRVAMLKETRLLGVSGSLESALTLWVTEFI